MIQTKHGILKEALAHIQAQGKVLKATWNAGGDETLCKIYVEERGQEVDHDFLWQDIQIDWELSDLIAERLELPNAGEMYNYGEGEVTLNAEGEMVIVYNCKEYAYACYQHGQPEMSRTTVFTDPFGLRQYTHRAKIMLLAEIDEAGQVETQLSIEVIEGDEPEVSAEALAHVKATLGTLIRQYVREGFPPQGSYPAEHLNNKPGGISMEGQLTDSQEITFTLLKEYEHLALSKQAQQVL
ncbi:hypothetical protein [uncultured Microscilla sp.]|uniref:hypothetical protein n=1 Tax=uncultured Microscilla sp. TaxID=432653 RepID=UPI00261AE551|nr:hypothetical protein [uncultured Microscilla sp.]